MGYLYIYYYLLSIYGHYSIIQAKGPLEGAGFLRRESGFHGITLLYFYLRISPDGTLLNLSFFAALSKLSCTTNSSKRANGLGIPQPERKNTHYIFFLSVQCFVLTKYQLWSWSWSGKIPNLESWITHSNHPNNLSQQKPIGSFTDKSKCNKDPNTLE